MNHQDSVEAFQEAVMKQYRQMILEAIIECEHDYKTRIDIGALHMKLNSILRAAQHDGIPRKIIDQMIDDCIPEKLSKAG